MVCALRTYFKERKDWDKQNNYVGKWMPKMFRNTTVKLPADFFAPAANETERDKRKPLPDY